MFLLNWGGEKGHIFSLINISKSLKKSLGKSTYKLWFSKTIIAFIVSNIKLDNYSSVEKLLKLSSFLFLDYKLSFILLLYLELLILQYPHNLPMCIMIMTVNSLVRESTNEPTCRLVTGKNPFFSFEQRLEEPVRSVDLRN